MLKVTEDSAYTRAQPQCCKLLKENINKFKKPLHILQDICQKNQNLSSSGIWTVLLYELLHKGEMKLHVQSKLKNSNS